MVTQPSEEASWESVGPVPKDVFFLLFKVKKMKEGLRAPGRERRPYETESQKGGVLLCGPD